MRIQVLTMRSPISRELIYLSAAVLACAFIAHPAQAAGTNMPWEQPLSQILDSIQGPVAKVMSVIVIILTGLALAFGETSGGFAAVDAQTGKYLWHFEASEPWKASPMTYMVNGHQYIAIASGSNILSFSLQNQQ